MNTQNIFNNDRKECIESLQFFFFLRKFYASLVKENNSGNVQIQEFINTIEKKYWRQVSLIESYTQSLEDYVFWESRAIYLENMKKFVSNQCSASDFAYTVYFCIRADQTRFEQLMEDFEKQATLELDPKIFQFSKVIGDFELILEGFLPEKTINMTDEELRQIIKAILPQVKKYFIDSNGATNLDLTISPSDLEKRSFTVLGLTLLVNCLFFIIF